MKEFKVGDKVRIKTLNSRHGELIGEVGAEGTVSQIETIYGDVWYYLEPYVSGGQFPAECLELVSRKKKKKSKTLFNIEDL